MLHIALYSLSLIPILLFVVVELWMDAFSLTLWKRLIFSILSGLLFFVVCFLIVRLLPESGAKPYLASVFEELCKGIPILFLLQTRRIVMLGDATIYGSAVGAGFAIGENIHIVAAGSVTPAMSVMLGFEAAVLHIGCSSLLASGLIMAKNESSSWSYLSRNLLVLGVFLIVMAAHIIHIVVPLNPIILTTILVFYFLISKRQMFKKNEKAIHEWIDQCLNNDVALLGSIRKGQLSQTNAGKYLLSIKDAFEPETFFDVCCYISEYLELSITAKSNLILKEAGFPIPKTNEAKARIQELKALHKRIGKAGTEAVAPIVSIDDVDQWALKDLL